MKNSLPLVILMSAFTCMQVGDTLATQACSSLANDEQALSTAQQAYKNAKSNEKAATAAYSAAKKAAQTAKAKDDKAKGVIRKDTSTVVADQRKVDRAKSYETKAEQVDSKAKDGITAANNAVTKAQGNYNDENNAITQFYSDSLNPPLSCNVTIPASPGMTPDCIAAIGTYNTMEAKLPALQKAIDTAKANVGTATTLEATAAGLVQKAKDAIPPLQQSLDTANQTLTDDTTAEQKPAGDLTTALATEAGKLADYKKAKDDSEAARQVMIAANTKVTNCKQNK